MLPDTSYWSLLTSWSATCNGISMATALQATDNGFPGYSGLWNFGGCTGTNSVSLSVLFIKK